ncbi:unnamed protein product [Prorocentrum cordatum]|uniref:Uncharacterized protein n=1 Tax=Prorocentrum cordatum TaxID=2364126 RepID=A0ABN9Q487_9DINO|nr:unnamed protein product [Polarella glacialis]
MECASVPQVTQRGYRAWHSRPLVWTSSQDPHRDSSVIRWPDGPEACWNLQQEAQTISAFPVCARVAALCRGATRTRAPARPRAGRAIDCASVLGSARRAPSGQLCAAAQERRAAAGRPQ